MPELKVGALTYGAFLSMVLPPPVVWKDLGLVNSTDEPFSEENCIDLRNNLIYRTVADKVDMLRANFPGETVEQVIGLWRSRQMWLPTSKRWISLWISSAASTTPPTPTPIS